MLFVIFFLNGLQAATLPRMGERNLLIVRAGVEQLFINYVAVIEKGAADGAEVSLQFPLLSNVLDFSTQEGLEKKDLTVNAKHFLEARVKLNEPQKVVSFVYVLPAPNGLGQIEFQSPYAMKELRVLIESNLQNNSDVLEKVATDSGEFPKTFVPYYYKSPISEYDKITISVTRVPTGRSSLYLLGGISALLLLASSIFFALKTTPYLVKG